MYHMIEFLGDLVVDLEISSKQPLEQLQVHKGSRFKVQLKPYVVQTEYGPLEVADLYFDDGTVTRSMPFACFCFPED